MRAVVQRVSAASVSVDGKLVSSIGKGLLVFLGVSCSDTAAEAEAISRKISGLRIFSDSSGKMNLSAGDVDGSVLLISNFTLYGNVRHGFRPEFLQSAPADSAEPLYEKVLSLISRQLPVKAGVFGADMKVCADNDGPVTIIIDTDSLK